ncbi:ankyrin repeat and EF-hand domain-containing protein 1-like [Haliotis rubra]|uniref:ankyrin repeat and EF-hand domain-containing protein 1-like n=1 Tax=Haliotis rubra TaxID=36100 RepID=UPI001EE60958|nr:ankyrin repeat and EF-hand domain-containing protein 1-like [Haliotis rubra]
MSVCKKQQCKSRNYVKTDVKRNYPRKREVNKQDSFANSPLHNACKKGDLKRVRRILSRGLVDMNIRDEKHGGTPLMVAAQEGHCRIFSYLIRNGADMAQVDNDGKNILHWAYKGGHMGVVECVLPLYGVDINSMHHPAIKQAAWGGGQIDVVEFLLCMGANVSQVDDGGSSVLHWACMAGHVSMVQYLLSQGSVDINSRGFDGITPLMVAARFGHVLFPGRFGRTPLMRAAYVGRINVFDQLVKKGGLTRLVDDNGNNILHLASLGGRVGMVKHILSLDMADINARDKDGKTAAMIAKRKRKLNV